MFRVFTSRGLKLLLQYINKLTHLLFVITVIHIYPAFALPSHHLSTSRTQLDEWQGSNKTIDNHYTSIHHSNNQLDHLLPTVNQQVRVPMSKQERQFSSRASYLNWLESQYDWHKIKLSGLLRVGDRDPVLHQIHARLVLLGDSDAKIQLSDTYSLHIADGIRNFQRRHGLNPDAIIGPETLKWLNLKPSRRAELLTLNMESKIDYMANLGSRYLIVNIPAYELLLTDKGDVALRSRVIVGKPKKPTPILTSEIKSMVINPSWRVPRSIVEDDLLPKVQADGNYLNERNFNVFNYQNQKVERSAEEWQQLANGHFPFRLEQMPGKNNALGRYKFYFPNDFSIFLHDTTNSALFSNAKRALSSGCIRVEKVDELANWIADSLVDDKSLWTSLKMSRDTTKWFPLNHALPVHFVYWTAWIDDSGLSQYRDDIYALQ